jgi:hypothetical protein
MRDGSGLGIPNVHFTLRRRPLQSERLKETPDYNQRTLDEIRFVAQLGST